MSSTRVFTPKLSSVLTRVAAVRFSSSSTAVSSVWATGFSSPIGGRWYSGAVGSSSPFLSSGSTAPVSCWVFAVGSTACRIKCASSFGVAGSVSGSAVFTETGVEKSSCGSAAVVGAASLLWAASSPSSSSSAVPASGCKFSRLPPWPNSSSSSGRSGSPGSS